jgi:RimJ/RimL family protein N-acetyltransferase
MPDLHDAARDLSHVRLGPQKICGLSVVLRQLRFDDFAEWRRIRLRDQRLIEPFWVSSPLDWASRHSQRRWLYEWLEQRDGARSGRSLSLGIEVDGRFAGQFDLGSISPYTRSAELGVWVDAELAHHGVGTLAAAMMLDFGFEALALERITAPISVDNAPASNGAASVGLIREAVMADYFDVGGRRRDHALWAATRDRIPPGGFTRNWVNRFESMARRSRPGIDTCDGPPETESDDPGRPPRSALLRATTRYRVGKMCHGLHRLVFGRPVTLAHAGPPAVILRTPKLGDYPALREFGPRSTVLGQDRRRVPEGSRPPLLPWLGEFMRWRRGFRAAGGLRFVIDVDGRIAGKCGLSDLDMFEGNADMYVWVQPDPAVRRITDSATMQLLDYAFGSLGLVRVSMEIGPGDQHGADAAARAGLVREGTMRRHVGPDGRRGDHELWAITANMLRNRLSPRGPDG